MTVTIEQRKKALENFLTNWPISKIESLTLEQYIKIDDKGTLAYWLEFGEGLFLGSIKGGDASKFGIYERKAEPKGNRQFISSDKRYSWKNKYGNSAESAFEKIKDFILKIIKAAQNDDLKSIEELDFEPALKWKLAFLYQNHQQPCVLPIYQLKMLQALMNAVPDVTHSSAYRHLMLLRGQESALQYGARLWNNIPKAEDDNTDDEESEGNPESDEGLWSSPTRHTLNQILFGPPGTGKTYATIYAALQILDPAAAGAYKQVDDDKTAPLEQRLAARTALKVRFDELATEQRVRFVTFHQSFSYEDFVEGLRAETVNGQVHYRVEAGVFKQICKQATATPESVSLDALLERFIEQVAETPEMLSTATGKQFLVSYGDGNATLTCEPQASKTAISLPANIEHVRALLAGKPVDKLYCASYVKGIVEHIRQQLPPTATNQSSNGTGLPYVLIIDEINRGNISRIFGELITLIEPSKRAGADEALSVMLPYSKDTFSVPDNVYLIGTMNTADRSLAGLDLALRRRFSFSEMPPRPELLDAIVVDGVNIGTMLRVMNQRITVLLDRDHTLGHTYFMPLQTEPTLPRLAAIFRQAILPLLQEYFFEDWERIRWVLNDQSKPQDLAFIVEDKALNLSALFPGVQDRLRQAAQWKMNDSAFQLKAAYQGIAANLNLTASTGADI